MNKIGIYSGSFNPIHFGHIKLAKYLITSKLVDEVWLIVSPQNPLKKETDLADDNLRLSMAKIAFGKQKKISVLDVEFHLPKPSYTIDTLNFLQKKYPQNQFFLLIGADNVAVFDKWKNYSEILEKFNVLCYPRENFPQKSDKFPQIQFINAPLVNISSTEIRNRLKNNLLCDNLLPKNVLKFIQKNHIY